MSDEYKGIPNAINYYPIFSTKREIIGYAAIRNDFGRRVPPKPSLEELDGDYYTNTTNEIDFEDWMNNE